MQNWLHNVSIITLLSGYGSMWESVMHGSRRVPLLVGLLASPHSTFGELLSTFRVCSFVHPFLGVSEVHNAQALVAIHTIYIT
jgi:hypothetical protein